MPPVAEQHNHTHSISTNPVPACPAWPRNHKPMHQLKQLPTIVWRLALKYDVKVHVS